MGYTHYWGKPNKKVEDDDKLVEIRGFLDKTLKKYSRIVQFESEVEQTPELYIDWVNNIISLRFNGKSSDGHETFSFSFEEGDFNFCKTSRKTYDIVVCECLLILHFYFDIALNSDGFSAYQPKKKYEVGDSVKSCHMDGNWGKAIKNVNKLLGIKFYAVVDKAYGEDNQHFSYKVLE